MPLDHYARSTAAPRLFVLGGDRVWVHPWTPRAIGEVQRFVMEVLGSPYDRAAEAIRDLPDDEARAAWVAAALAARETWPPDVLSTDGLSVLLTPPGRARLVWAVGRRHTPELTWERAEAIGEVMSDEEVIALLGCLAPGETGDLRDPDASGSTPYAEIRARLCEEFPGWTFADIDDMTFDQIADAWRKGKPRVIEIEDQGQVEGIAGRWRDYYVGL